MTRLATVSKEAVLAMENEAAPTPAPNPTARLTLLMRRGDEDAYRKFFGLFFHRLLAYLLVVTRGNEALARDLVQQTMIKVAKHIRVFEDEAVLWRWMTLLARTAAVDEARKSQRYFGFLERFRRGQKETEVHESDFEELLRLGMQELDAEDRALLGKKYFENLSVRHIAADMGTTEKAVESQLTRARLKLKRIVTKGLE